MPFQYFSFMSLLPGMDGMNYHTNDQNINKYMLKQNCGNLFKREIGYEII